MKKLYTLLTVLLITGMSFGQTARLVLLEEFTGETCGPCAAYNPGMNAILDANAATVISLKYQNNIPSTGPNFYTYNTTDIGSRTQFYANTYSPHAFIDGNYWEGNAASVTAAQLTTRGGVMSPFSINVSHSFSVAHDIIYIHAVIRASQAVSSANPLKAQIAVAERNVYGYTSPNGESEYSHVMRKLLPSGTGTTLPSTWAIGDSVVIDQQWTITPSTTSYASPIWAMLEGIVWVQENVTKEIKQTGHSPALVSLDPAIVSVTGVTTVTCTSVTPSVTLTNNEATPATSIDIEYYLDAQTPAVYNWTGNLTQGGTASVTLPSLTLTPGVHAVTVNITNVNGAPDLVPSNNLFSVPAGKPLTSSTAWSETFAGVTFPPVNWINDNPDHTAGWSRASATSNTPGTGSAKIDFYNSTGGNIDQMFPLVPVDLTTAVAPTLTFKVAHRQYAVSGANSSDQLEVMVSTNCGTSWTSVWNKSGATLSTVAGALTSAFTPTAAQWRAESVDLTPYVGQNNVLIAFKATSDYGNNAYVDQIFLSPWNFVGVTENPNSAMVNVYPSPSTGNININVERIASAKMDITVTNIIGKVVKQLTYDKSEGNVITLDLSNEATGNYLVKIVTDSETILKRAVIQK